MVADESTELETATEREDDEVLKCDGSEFQGTTKDLKKKKKKKLIEKLILENNSFAFGHTMAKDSKGSHRNASISIVFDILRLVSKRNNIFLFLNLFFLYFFNS